MVACLPDHRLILCPGLASFSENRLLGFVTKPVIDYTRQITESRGHSGFRIPTVNQSATLALANDGSGTLEAVELPLDSIQ